MSEVPYVLHPVQDLPGEGVGVKASAESTGGSITLVDSQTSGGAPLHVHRNEDECFYVLDGRIIVRCGEERWEIGPGGFVFLPRGIPHAWDVLGDEARLLIITTPGGFEQFLTEFHQTTDQKALDEISQRHGITFLPDPEW
jgi:quercetin dioxygenase-like cupin family protein